VLTTLCHYLSDYTYHRVEETAGDAIESPDVGHETQAEGKGDEKNDRDVRGYHAVDFIGRRRGDVGNLGAGEREKEE